MIGGCSSEKVAEPESAPQAQTQTNPAPTPSVSELGIEVTASGLAELQDKVSGREDSSCSSLNRDFVCIIGNGTELYIFSMGPDGKTQTAMFRGYVSGDGGDIEFQQRGWYYGDAVTAGRIFNRLIKNGPLPTRPSPE